MTDRIFSPDIYWRVLISMTALAPIIFIALHKINAGYGMMRSAGWGPSISNRIGWILMEMPSFAAMLAILLAAPAQISCVPLVMAIFFLAHYFQRSFIFPLLMRGKSKMPLAIILMGMVFNTINAYLIGGWLFFIAPKDYYPLSWLVSPQFIAGTVIFIAGIWINLQSDNIVRHLRKPGDTRHYIPRGGMYRYVASANYFGEFLEWTGYAVLTWSAAGAVFALWTFANLAPRAAAINRRYASEFGESYTSLHRRNIIPFIY